MAEAGCADPEAGATRGQLGIALGEHLSGPLGNPQSRTIWAELPRDPAAITWTCGLLANLLGLQLQEPLALLASCIGSAATALGLMATSAAVQFRALHAGMALGASVLNRIRPLAFARLAAYANMDIVHT